MMSVVAVEALMFVHLVELETKNICSSRNSSSSSRGSDNSRKTADGNSSNQKCIYLVGVFMGSGHPP